MKKGISHYRFNELMELADWELAYDWADENCGRDGELEYAYSKEGWSAIWHRRINWLECWNTNNPDRSVWFSRRSFTEHEVTHLYDILEKREAVSASQLRAIKRKGSIYI